LVYFLVPRPAAGASFSELAIAHDARDAHRRSTAHSMLLEGQAVASAPANDQVDQAIAPRPVGG
jgi:hypothetical protein